MEAIIVKHDRIYGSIGLYIPLSLHSRDNIFRYLFREPPKVPTKKMK